MAAKKVAVRAGVDPEVHAKIVADAAALGISVDGRTDKQLGAAIKQARVGGEGHNPLGDAPVNGSEKGATVAHVDEVDGARIRTYSKAEHGADFMALAKEFAGKAEGRVVVAE